MPKVKEKASLSQSSADSLQEGREGIRLVDNHAKMVWQGNKKLIVRPELFEDKVGRLLYLVGGNNCYGIIKLTGWKEIDLKEFSEKNAEHRITEAERALWWPGKEKLFAYNVAVIALFDNPKLVKASSGGFIDMVDFLSDLQARQDFLEKNISSYEPKDYTDKEIENDVKIVFALCEAKASGQECSFSEEKVEVVLEKAVVELGKRGHSVDVSKLKSSSKELYGKVFAKTIVPMSEVFMAKPKKVFYDRNEVVSYFFG